ncbi:hypothetical protein Tco_0399660 [Tanacetum coccineum]
MTVGEVNTRVVELAELHERDIQDLYALLEDAQDSRSRISQRVDMDSQRVDLLMGDRMTLQETVWMVEGKAYASCVDLGSLVRIHTRSTTAAKSTLFRHSTRYRGLAFTGACLIVAALHRRLIVRRQDQLLGAALIGGMVDKDLRSRGIAMTWEVLKKRCQTKYCPQGEFKKLELRLWYLKVKGKQCSSNTLNVSKELNLDLYQVLLPMKLTKVELYIQWTS